MIYWQTPAEAHAALNDLPPVLFVASVLFDVLGTATRRESLKAAGYWTLLLGAVGAVVAVATGLLAADTIEHGEAIHEAMGVHKTLAIAVTITFAVLAYWRVARRGTLPPAEWRAYLVIAALGAGLVTYVAHLGGNIVYRLGGGIPRAVMEDAMRERAEGHHHHGDEPDEHADTADHDHDHAVDSGASVAHTDSAPKHVDQPGAPPHRHQ